MCYLLGYKSEEELAKKAENDFDKVLNRPTGWVKDIIDDDNRIFETRESLDLMSKKRVSLVYQASYGHN